MLAIHITYIYTDNVYSNMTFQIQKERISQRQQVAKVVRGIAILAGVTAIVTVVALGLGF